MRLSKGQRKILEILVRNRESFNLDFFTTRREITIFYKSEKTILNSLRNLVKKGLLKERNYIYGSLAFKSKAKKKIKHSDWKITKKGIDIIKRKGY
ncbi:MAG: hypothetical protein ACFFG0_17965 [Candidatus Thorarchaeota archaeon]